MYSYTYDTETGGILLNSSPTVFSKEPRPVYSREMDILGFDRFFEYEKQDDTPYMWAESATYWYRGTQVAKVNQRSMFDFIKTPKELDTKAFQWFIQNFGPTDDRPLITIDMLWDFFYVKGSGYLSSDIKLILDTFPQQTMLQEKEKVVLKTILIMQAIDQRLGGAVEVLKPTDQNLSYAFEGDWDVYENECKGIAKGLVSKGVLILSPIADNKKVYNAAVLAGDGAKIEGYAVWLSDIKRQKKCMAELFDGSDPIGSVKLDIKGKTATVNSDFDDMF